MAVGGFRSGRVQIDLAVRSARHSRRRRIQPLAGRSRRGKREENEHLHRNIVTRSKMHRQSNLLRRFVLGLALASSACGSSGSTSVAPSTPAVAQVGGNWAVTMRLTTVTGGECLAALFQEGIGGTNSGTLSVNQSRASLAAT